MKIIIASDHGGYNLKKEIYDYLSDRFEITDIGTNSAQSCDYPDFAKQVAKAIQNKEYDRGILICGTGIGMAITANRFKGIRAANVSDTFSAKMTRMHNDSNILTLGERVIGVGLAKDIVDIWLKTEFKGGRHQKRIDLIEQ
ncbi:MAG: ribose 5-phosphate isomerase B [Candidatus Gastranaerophilales bacterium]|nr:ribose 5-phosphate isomerase B [Candidatus Gastranaerophilales bacterium]